MHLAPFPPNVPLFVFALEFVLGCKGELTTNKHVSLCLRVPYISLQSHTWIFFAQDDDNMGLTVYVATRWYRAPEIMLSWTEYTNAVDVWSVGCILAEIIGRRPLFPGRDYINQLNLVTNIIGKRHGTRRGENEPNVLLSKIPPCDHLITRLDWMIGKPSKDDMEHIQNDRARRYIDKLPNKERAKFSELYPDAEKTAIDLLEKMLVFDPAKRVTVEEALEHPYLASLHDLEDEPIW